MRTSVTAAVSLGFVLLLLAPAALDAQDATVRVPGPGPSALRVKPDLSWAMDRQLARDTVPRDIRPTHWKEGALIGGLSLGLGAALLFDALCRSSDNVSGSCSGYLLGGFLLGGVVGGIAGALIGGQFPKDTVP